MFYLAGDHGDVVQARLTLRRRTEDSLPQRLGPLSAGALLPLGLASSSHLHARLLFTALRWGQVVGDKPSLLSFLGGTNSTTATTTNAADAIFAVVVAAAFYVNVIVIVAGGGGIPVVAVTAAAASFSGQPRLVLLALDSRCHLSMLKKERGFWILRLLL